MTSPILFAGGEDLDFQFIGAALQPSPTNGNWGIDTTYGRFRSNYSRYALTVTSQGQAFSVLPIQNTTWIRNASLFTSSEFWCSARLVTSTDTPLGYNTTTLNPIRWADSAGIVRLVIAYSSGSNNNPTSTFIIQKRDSSGTLTQIGSASNTGFGNFANTGSPDKLDFYVKYGISGEVKVYLNGLLTLDVTGDLTTDGNTSLSYFDMGVTACTNGNTVIYRSSWSEIIVSTRDTRNMSLVTQVPAMNGNTDAWSSGGTSTVSQNSNSSVVAHWTLAANTALFSKFNVGISGTINSVSFELFTGITGNSQAALYSVDATGNPATLLSSTNVITNPSSGSTSYTFTDGPVITSGQIYFVAFWTNAIYLFDYYQGANYGMFSQTGLTGGFPSDAAGITLLNPSFGAVVQVTATELNIAAPIADDASPDSSAIANQVQQYEVSPSIPSGNFTVVSVVQHVRATIGTTGPTKLELGVRTHGADYFSSVISPDTGWATYQYNWDTNPNTGVKWTLAELAANSSAFNIGYKSIT